MENILSGYQLGPNSARGTFQLLAQQQTNQLAIQLTILAILSQFKQCLYGFF
jgi:hypothetical protein